MCQFWRSICFVYYREPLKIELRQYEIQKPIDVSQPELGVFLEASCDCHEILS